MKKIFFFVLVFLLISCSLFDPINFIVKNNSSYDITVSFDKGNKNNIKIKKSKGDFFLFYPGNIRLNVKIEEIKFEKEYNINLEYKKDYLFEFKIEK